MYKFPEEIIKRFREIDTYRYQEFDRAINAYQEILQEYAEDGRVVARAYFCLGETAAMMTDFEKSEAYYKLGIQYGKEYGAIVTWVSSILHLGNIKIAQNNEAKAAEYLYEGLALIEAHQLNNLYGKVYMMLGQLFDSAEDYETAVHYYTLGAEAFLKEYPDAKEKYAVYYGVRILSIASCHLELGKLEELQQNIQELEAINFAGSLLIGKGVLLALKGYVAYLKGEKETAGALMQQVVEEFANSTEVLDAYNIFSKVYEVLEACSMVKEQKQVVDLMEKYNRAVSSPMCNALYVDLKIRYSRQVQDKEALLEAYEAYYAAEKTYHTNSARQKQEYIKLRKRLYEEEKESKRKLAELKEQSTIDEVTRLENRHSLLAYTNQTFAEAMEKQQSFGVLLLDVDRFKEFNDTYGHVEGDKCLQQVAEIFKTVLKGQFCARYGGDEFICIFSGTAREQIQEFCEEIHKQVKELYLPHQKNTPYGLVTVSLGASIRIPTEQDDFVMFLQEADEKLYQCKENGRCKTIL